MTIEIKQAEAIIKEFEQSKDCHPRVKAQVIDGLEILIHNEKILAARESNTDTKQD